MNLIFNLILIFRHADREVVLEHVKSHYRDDGTPQENQTSSGMELAPPPPLPIQTPFQIMNNLLNGHAGTSSTTTNVHNRNLLTLGGGANQLQPSNSNSTSTHPTLNFNSQNTLTTPSSSSHDVGKNINGMPDTNSTNSSLKGSFRCGHCGQISNWKHVIQVYTNSSFLPPTPKSISDYSYLMINQTHSMTATSIQSNIETTTKKQNENLLDQLKVLFAIAPKSAMTSMQSYKLQKKKMTQRNLRLDFSRRNILLSSTNSINNFSSSMSKTKTKKKQRKRKEKFFFLLFSADSK